MAQATAAPWGVNCLAEGVSYLAGNPSQRVKCVDERRVDFLAVKAVKGVRCVAVDTRP